MKYVLVIAFFISGINTFGQEKMVLKSKVTEQSVLLRWTFRSVEDIKLYLKSELVLKRIESDRVGENDWSKAEVLANIKIPGKSDPIWNSILQKNKNAPVVYSFLFPDKTPAKEVEGNLFGLALLGLDLDPALAYAIGFGFRDTTFSKGKTYVYRIEIKGITKTANEEMVDTDKIPEKVLVTDWRLFAMGKSVEINWNSKNHQSDFCSYVLERSMDSLNFTPLISDPLVPVSSQFEKNKTNQLFTDTTVRENSVYWYRIYGIDHFGETGEISKSRKVKVGSPFRGEIRIDTLYETGNGKAKLKFHLTNSSDVQRLNKISAYRSSKVNGSQEFLFDIDKSASELEFTAVKGSHYITLMAENAIGEKISTWPHLLIVPDRTPPHQPEGLIGEIDRKGKVTLRWNNNSDADLRGYRVFRSNALHEEFVEISRKLVFQNFFSDSLPLETLTEEIYYRINAVDSSYNNSVYSISVQLQKPDYIAPEVSPFVKAEPRADGNFLKWSRSHSSDLVRIEIRRSTHETNWEKMELIQSTDTMQSYLDTDVSSGTGYFYRTVSVDDANNFTESASVYLVNDVIQELTKSNLSYSVDRNKKIIQLNWDKPKGAIYSYSIYKAKKGNPIRFYKELEPTTIQWLDDELQISNTYIYYVKATMKGGKEVSIGEIEVVY